MKPICVSKTPVVAGGKGIAPCVQPQDIGPVPNHRGVQHAHVSAFDERVHFAKFSSTAIEQILVTRTTS